MLFNSLGSNYSFEFVFKSLFSVGSKKNSDLLKVFLTDKYGGEIVLLYKNREAIKLALSLLNLPKGSKVGINGFTCYVVYQAVKEAGLTPEYLDIGKKDLNFSFDALEKNKDLKALIIQNTLGDPCEIEKISEYCQKNNIYLIEDLAHSVGTKYDNGKEAGTVGDFVALSFSQDKIIDAVSGGALIIRNKKFKNLINQYKFKNIGDKQRIRDRFYPFLTYKIRKTYFIGLGKLLHFIFKKLSLLSQPMGVEKEINFHKLPDWHSGLALFQLNNFKETQNHRESIVKIYNERIDSGVRIPFKGNVRFPILVERRTELIKFLKEKGIYVSDIWYDAPIAPKKFLKLTNYDDQCPNSEEISRKILNLPTHININYKDAEKISGLINLWIKSK